MVSHIILAGEQDLDLDEDGAGISKEDIRIMDCFLDRQGTSWRKPFWQSPTEGQPKQPAKPPSEIPSLCSKTTCTTVSETPADDGLEANSTNLVVTASMAGINHLRCLLPVHKTLGPSTGPSSSSEAAAAGPKKTPTLSPTYQSLANIESDDESDWETILVNESSPRATLSSSGDSDSCMSTIMSTAGPSRVLGLQSRLRSIPTWILNNRREALLRAFTANGGTSRVFGTSSSGGDVSTTASATSGRSSQSGASVKRPWFPPGDDQDDQGQMGGGGSSKRSCTESDAPPGRLACPFQKVLGQTGINVHCGMPNGQNPLGGYVLVRRIKEHVLKWHNPLRRCKHCWAVCETEEAAAEHQVTDGCSRIEGCDRPLMQPEQVDRFREQRFKGKIKGPQKEADKWYNLTEFLFPNFEAIGLGSIREFYTPYYEPVGSVNFNLPQHFLQNEAGRSAMSRPLDGPGPLTRTGFNSMGPAPVGPQTARDTPAMPLARLIESIALPGLDWTAVDMDLFAPAPLPQPMELPPLTATQASDTQDHDPDNPLHRVILELQNNNQSLREEAQRCRKLYSQVLEDSRVLASRLNGLHEELAVELAMDNNRGATTKAFEALAVSRELMFLLTGG